MWLAILPRMKSQRISNKRLVEAVWTDTGHPRREVTAWFNVFAMALFDSIAAGRVTMIQKVGTFSFKKRKGRTTRWAAGQLKATNSKEVTSVQPDSIIIKFKASKFLRDKLNKRNK